MARNFGRVLASIWDDEDFGALSMEARFAYVFLISQPDLDHAGVIPLRIGRWADSLRLTRAEVEKALTELDSARFTVTDWRKEELLVRSLIRRDEVWRQPNVFKSAAASAVSCKSARIKGVLLTEIRRLDLSGASREIQRTRDELLTLLEPFGNPPPTPPGVSQEHLAEHPAATPVDNDSGETAETGNVAGEKGSVRVAEPFAEGTGELRGKGSSCIPVPDPLPLKPSPSPRGAARPVTPLWPSAVPDVRPEGEEDQPGDETPDIAALVAEVRKIRPAWSSQSIGRALANPSVAERPWSLVRAAMLAVARDPDSQQPGRLAHDGPWWTKAAPERPRRPPWCGHCRESTRRLEDADGYDAGPCPNCHPRALEAS